MTIIIVIYDRALRTKECYGSPALKAGREPGRRVRMLA